MKLPRLDAFCSNDNLRPVMNCVYIDGNYAVAADMHILIKVCITDYFENIEKLNGKLIHKSVWWNMTHASYRNVTETGIKCTFQNYICEFGFFTDGVYPNYMSVFPHKKESEKVEFVKFKPSLLKKLSLITDDFIQFKFINNFSEIMIMNNDFAGIIMPATIFDTERWMEQYRNMIGL